MVTISTSPSLAVGLFGAIETLRSRTFSFSKSFGGAFLNQFDTTPTGRNWTDARRDRLSTVNEPVGELEYGDRILSGRRRKTKSLA